MWEHEGWGDVIHFYDYEKREITGHVTPMIRVGDMVHCKMNSGSIDCYEVTSVNYKSDPPDMFFGTVEDRGYVEETEYRILEEQKYVDDKSKKNQR